MLWGGLGVVRVMIDAGSKVTRAGVSGMLAGEPDIQIEAQLPSLDGLPQVLPEIDVFIELPGPEGQIESNRLDALLTDIPAGIGLLLAGGVDAASSRILRQQNRPWGILPEDFSSEDLVIMVKALAQGFIAFTPPVVDYFPDIAAQDTNSATGQPSGLTERELEVLGYIADGMANKQIADFLKISPNTVKYHLASIYEKLGVSNRAEAVTRGIQSGWLIV